MPAYDYRCGECSDTFELIARMGQAPDAPDCPKGDGGIGARVFGAGVAIHTGAASSSFDDFDLGGMDDLAGLGGMPGMGGHGHDHGHSHDDFDFDDF